jgi:hypothetical protein
VCGNVSNHRTDHAQFIRDGSQFRENLAQFESTLSALGKLEGRRKRNAGITGQLLVPKFGQLRLRIERIEMAGSTSGENMNDMPGFRGDGWLSREQRGDLTSVPAVIHEAGQGDSTQAQGASLKKLTSAPEGKELTTGGKGRIHIRFARSCRSLQNRGKSVSPTKIEQYRYQLANRDVEGGWRQKSAPIRFEGEATGPKCRSNWLIRRRSAFVPSQSSARNKVEWERLEDPREQIERRKLSIFSQASRERFS